MDKVKNQVCVDGDIEDDELFKKLVGDWYLEVFV